MKRLGYLALGLFVSSTGFSYGTSCTTRQIGSTSYTNCSDGTSETTRKIGDTDYTSGNNYRTGEAYNTTTRDIGGTKYESRYDYGSKRDDDSRSNSYGDYGSYGDRKKTNSWGW